MTKYCDCCDCKASDDPCQFDCSLGFYICNGCYESYADKLDVEFEIDKSLERL